MIIPAYARAVIQVLPHVKNVLIGGCSSGMGVVAVRELGYGLTEIGKRLGMTQPGVGYAVVKRGERIADQNNYLLIDELVI